MAVKITVGSPTYNKGAAPSNEPPENLYPICFELNEGHKVWVSLPRPDKLHLAGELLPEHFGTKEELSAVGPFVTAALASGQFGNVAHTLFAGGIYKEVQVEFGSSGGFAFFKLRNAGKVSPAVHQLVLHCNPALLGQDGIFDLIDGLHKIPGLQFKVGAFLADARVSRLDVAVDLVGLGVPEIIASADQAGKHVHYYGSDGTLETVAIHKKHKINASGQPSKKAKQKPLGDLLVMLYDKRRQLIANGNVPPFGESPMTRVEISKRQFGNKVCGLVSLPNLSNPFAKIKIGQVRTAGPKGSWEWLRYVEARRGGGAARAAFVNNLSPSVAEHFANLYSDHPSDVVDATAVWPLWSQGIESAGLNYMIEAAEQLSSGVPLPLE